jgi:polygalacturonase
MKTVSPRYASTDGFDISNSNNIRISNCFVRTCDDAIAIKGLVKDKPANCPPNENLLFENLHLWNDCNNAICLGAETRASKYENINFRNIDVISSYDDKYHHEELDERSVMSIVSLEGTYFKNITWENINVNRCERLICLTFKDQFWFGSIKGDQSTPGGIENISFKNVYVTSNSGSNIANEILLNGWYMENFPTKKITNVSFDNVVVEGKLINSMKDIKTNNTEDCNLVLDILFL